MSNNIDAIEIYKGFLWHGEDCNSIVEELHILSNKLVIVS